MSVSPEEYKKCLEAVELEDIRLAGIRARGKGPTEMRSSSKGGGLEAHVALETEHQVIGRRLTVYVVAHVTGSKVESGKSGKAGKSGKGEPVIDIRATFALVYSFAPTFVIDGPVIEQFIRRNVPINAWPYIREIIADMTVRMGYPKLVLPTLKLLR